MKAYIDKASREQKAEDAEDGNSCAICMEDFRVGGDKVAQLSCDGKHIFHTECLKAWVEKNSICPMCRKEIP